MGKFSLPIKLLQKFLLGKICPQAAGEVGGNEKPYGLPL